MSVALCEDWYPSVLGCVEGDGTVRVFKWLAKRGTAGGTARTLIRQYLDFRSSRPHGTDAEFYAAVVAMRHASWRYTDVQMKRLALLLGEDPIHLREFIVGVIFVEADWGPYEMARKGDVICEIVEEELAASGLTGPHRG